MIELWILVVTLNNGASYEVDYYHEQDCVDALSTLCIKTM